MCKVFENITFQLLIFLTGTLYLSIYKNMVSDIRKSKPIHIPTYWIYH